MEPKEIELNGRKYIALFSPDMPPGAYIILGPPEGLVDSMGLPEPFATHLHNVLFSRRIFNFKDLSKGNTAFGVLQEALGLDTQKLSEAFFNFEKETV